MVNIDILTNERYKVLEYLYQNKDKNNVVNITQNEVC